ncbi:Rrf2 family transcriptional regulator [Haloactinospora alba]|uniref:Rrf2 family transcriptional regulator n=1 Tax=Haloactinospora alba TaxID=405555 RepID=UPI001B883870|nr:Rrf2 family transcriptional regulator [Haloactinospora alba]
MSSRCAVAVHALTLLARNGGEQLLASAEIAESLESNPVVVRRVLGRLRDASLVFSVEGSGGGWRLARSPHGITLCDAYRAVEEGPMLSLHAHPPSSSCVVGRNIQGLLEAEFTAAEHAATERLAQTTIADMLGWVLARDLREAAPED